MRLIDADELLQTVSIKSVFGNEINKMKCGELRKILEMIENAPTIEPQRMRGKGRWNVYYHGEENGKSIFSYSCNQCGYGAPYNFIGGVCEQKKWNFCPNCGAWMRGDLDENN